MWTVSFWKGAGERALRTFAQTLVALIGVGSVSIVTLPWGEVLAVSATAAVLSVLTSIVASGVGEDGPSFGPEVKK